MKKKKTAAMRSVYVAGSIADRWIFWEGQVFVMGTVGDLMKAGPDKGPACSDKTWPAAYILTAPCLRAVKSASLVQPGAAVEEGRYAGHARGDEMGFPVRAPADGKLQWSIAATASSSRPTRC